MGCLVTKCKSIDDVWEPSSHPSVEDPSYVGPFKNNCILSRFMNSEELSRYPDVIAYMVDEDGSILDILTQESWSAAAAAGGAELPLREVIGKCLFTFMLPFLRSFYSEVVMNLARAKLGSCVSFRWFCDSPEERKEMVLYMENTECGIVVVSVTINVESHQAGFLQHIRVRDDTPRKNCSICNRFYHEGQWLTPEDYYAFLAQKVEFSALTVSHVVCTSCSKQVVLRIAPRFSEAHGYFDSTDSEQSELNQPAVPGVIVHPKQPIRVLIVDDDRVTAKILEALARAMGYIPHVLTDPHAVWDFLKTTTVQGIVMDVVMPEVMGYDLVRNLRDLGVAIPIFCMSGCTEYAAECLRAGAQKFLVKPVTSSGLQQVLGDLRAA